MESNGIKTVGSNIRSLDAKKVNKRPFELKEKCQEYAADIYNVTSIAPKELRTSLCKKIQDISTELVHMVRLANGLKLGTSDRRSAQRDVIELLERSNDLLPILTKCRCITPEQEKVLEKKQSNLKKAINVWIQKDMERLDKKDENTSAGHA